MEIERVLKWAYVDELPHWKVGNGPAGYGAGWASVNSYVELLTTIDYNVMGVLPDLMSMRLPHADALVVADAVQSLTELELGLPDDWDPFADVDGETRDLARAAAVRALRSLVITSEDGRQRLRKPVARLIVRHAILGDAPDWEGGPFKVEVERNTYGQPAWYRRAVRGTGRDAVEVEVDGFDAKRRRPYLDAYQRHYLEPDAFPVAVARAEYELWHAAMGFLAEDLAGRLESIRISPTAYPARPWETGSFEGHRILRPVEQPGAS